MVIEICILAVTIGFLILVVFLSMALMTFRKELKRVERNVAEVSAQALPLIHNANELTKDLKRKTDAFNFIFRVLNAFNKEVPPPTMAEMNARNTAETVVELIDLVKHTVALYKKIRK